MRGNLVCECVFANNVTSRLPLKMTMSRRRGLEYSADTAPRPHHASSLLSIASMPFATKPAHLSRMRNVSRCAQAIVPARIPLWWKLCPAERPLVSRGRLRPAVQCRSGKISEWLGARKGISLQEVASELAQHHGVLHRLDTFGNSLDAERTPDLND